MSLVILRTHFLLSLPVDFSTVCEEVDVEFAESIFCTNVMLIGFSVCGGGILILFCFKLKIIVKIMFVIYKDTLMVSIVIPGSCQRRSCSRGSYQE